MPVDPLVQVPLLIGQFTIFTIIKSVKKNMVFMKTMASFKDFWMRFYQECELLCFWKWKGLRLALFFSFPWVSPNGPHPGRRPMRKLRRYRTFWRSRNSLAPHLGARRGGAVRRSELRKKNRRGLSHSPLPWVDPHGTPSLFCWCFHTIHHQSLLQSVIIE